MRHLTSFFVALSLTACASANLNKNTPPQEYETLEITLDRSSCLGTCPEYVVKVSGSGEVSYCGFNYVEEKGLRTKQIDPADIRSLYEQVLGADFFNLEDHYRTNVTDSALYITTVSVDGRTKTIYDYVGRESGMPNSVTEIQDAIDEITGTSEWIGDVPNNHHLGAFEAYIPNCEDQFRPGAKAFRKKIRNMLNLPVE